MSSTTPKSPFRRKIISLRREYSEISSVKEYSEISCVKEVRIILPSSKDCEYKEVNIVQLSIPIEYIPYNEFKIKFPKTGINLGVGTNSEVYESNEFVVKIYKDIIDEMEFNIELNAYSLLIHPCIIRPIAWSIYESKGYIAMPKGIKIHEAYENKFITIEQIISNILSAINFLNSNGYAHADIKPSNMIYHENRVKLIDMGMFRKAKLNNDGEYYVTGEAYTSVYKDPEYVAGQYNNFKCEIYSIAMSCIEILKGSSPNFGQLYNYTSDNANVNWFLNEAKKILRDRQSITCLLQHAPPDLIMHNYTGTIFNVSPLLQDRKCDEHVIIIMNWLVTIAHKHYFSMQVLFLSLHLIHRTYSDIMLLYNNAKDILKVYGCVIMHIVCNIMFCNVLDINDWKDESDSSEDDDFKDKFHIMYLNILRICKGIIFTLTYWDYAQSKQDLIQLLHDTINCNYNPNLIRQVSGIGNKCVLVREVLSKEDMKLYRSDFKMEQTLALRFPTTKILPCRLDISSNIKIIEHEWRNGVIMTDINIDYTFPTLLHNRDALRYVNNKISIEIFLELIRVYRKIIIYRELVNTLLVTICGKYWLLHIDNVIAKGGNPFMNYFRMNSS